MSAELMTLARKRAETDALVRDLVTLIEARDSAGPPATAFAEWLRGNMPDGTVIADAVEDASRFRWLTEDHADPETRVAVRSICRSIPTRSLSGIRIDIDANRAIAPAAPEPKACSYCLTYGGHLDGCLYGTETNAPDASGATR